jgi:hypothetical protein
MTEAEKMLDPRNVMTEHELATLVRRCADDVRSFLCWKQLTNASCLQSATLRFAQNARQRTCVQEF